MVTDKGAARNQAENMGVIRLVTGKMPGLDVLSCGAGMQSTALALMACENKAKGVLYPQVPVYDVILFVDVGREPEWVYHQVAFIKHACEACGIPFIILKKDLYQHYMDDFGQKRVTSVPFWTMDQNGKKGKMPRHCTLDFKISFVQQYVKHHYLGYKKGQHNRPQDLNAHRMHIGFSAEERRRAKPNPHPLFVNWFPLIDMGLERKDNYRYIKDVWGLDTKASACIFCPFHRNYFFEYLRMRHNSDYQELIVLDNHIEKMQPRTKINGKLYISRSRKRIVDLLPEECQDAECFPYQNQWVWNGF